MAEDTRSGDLETRVEAWRRQNNVREDDPVFLLLDLFRIHLNHWDDHRQQATRGQSEPEVANASPQELGKPKPGSKAQPWVQRMAAVAGIGLAAVGGFMLGRGFQ